MNLVVISLFFISIANPGRFNYSNHCFSQIKIRVIQRHILIEKIYNDIFK